MTNNKTKLTGTPINQIIIPGAHDAGSYNISSSSKITPTITKWASLVPCIVAPISKCQKFDIINQLNIGIRFFDLRIYYLNNQQWLGHGQYSISLANAFQNVSQWLDDHPNEVIILMATFEMDPVDISVLMSLVGQNHIAPYSNLQPTNPIDDYWAANQNCIIALDDDYASQYDLWPCSQTITNPWPNLQSISSLKTWCDNNLPTTYNNNINVAQLLLTPTFSTVIVGGVPATFANSINKNMITWMDDWINNNKKLNIILSDFVGTTNGLIDQIINYNFQ